MEKKIIIALDDLSKKEACTIARETSELVWGFKVHELLIREGFSVIATLKQYGKVFVDLKFHDIPSTVENEVRALLPYEPDIITVHASGGESMLKSAVHTGGNTIAAITALTSLTTDDIQALYQSNPEETVKRLANIAVDAEVQSIVCSPYEIKLVRSLAPEVQIITPGIRSEKSKDDQGRTLSAKEAVARGADLLVIGRPITKAPNPRLALEEIVASF